MAANGRDPSPIIVLGEVLDLFIADGSMMPTQGSAKANPAPTIMALAARGWRSACAASD